MPKKGQVRNLVGDRYGKLTVLAAAEPYVHHGAGGTKPFTQWLVRCDCGREAIVRGDGMRMGKSTACGSCWENPRFEDLTGQRFGRWTVLSLESRRGERARWSCQCDCGTRTLHASNTLKHGMSKSCGCLKSEVTIERNTTHGMTGTPTHKTWLAMIARCTYPSFKDWHLYGGRGIRVCDRWLESFANFLADMGERPEGKTIDRFPDHNGNYEPGNCRWATAVEQARNMRSTRVTLDMAAEILGRHEMGESAKSIARRMNLCDPTVRQAIRGVSWKELARPWLTTSDLRRSA